MMTTAVVVAWPGTWIAGTAISITIEIPTGGASQFHSRAPASLSAACPTTG